MLTDSHCHLDSYGPDLPAVLARARDAGVTTLLAIGIGEGPDTMHEALALARTHATRSLRILASAGIHPQEAHQATPANLARLTALLDNPLTVAVGEIGLDYYHVENPDIPTQQAAFVAQLQIAASAGKPILIHLRSSELATPAARAKFISAGSTPDGSASAPADVWADFFRLIAEHWTPTGLPGVMHCFSGGPAEAERALAARFYLSFAGNITYPKADLIRDAARIAPLDRLLVETDAPFLAPIPHRGEQNEPALVRLTLEFLADLRGLTPADLAAHTTANFNRLITPPAAQTLVTPPAPHRRVTPAAAQTHVTPPAAQTKELEPVQASNGDADAPERQRHVTPPAATSAAAQAHVTPAAVTPPAAQTQELEPVQTPNGKR